MKFEEAKYRFPDYYKDDVISRIIEISEETELEVYRICKNGLVNEDSFKTTYEENLYNHMKAFGMLNTTEIDDLLGEYSLSTYTKERDARRMLGLFSKRNPAAIIAKGKTDKEEGLFAYTKNYKRNKNSHVDWWLFKNATPHIHFKVHKSVE